MTEPTDVGPSTADQLFRLIRSFGYTTHGQTAEIVDAIVAKWGTPPAVVGEPCGWAMFRPDGSSENSADGCLFALSESEVACGQKPGYMAATNGWKPQPIYTTPQPTRAQAGAEQRQMDARHAAIYRWIIQHIDKAASIIDAWREDGEADKDELHDALAARAAKEGAKYG